MIEGVVAEDDVLSIVEAAEDDDAEVEAEVEAEDEDEKGGADGDDALFPDRATERVGVGNETGVNEEPVSGVEMAEGEGEGVETGTEAAVKSLKAAVLLSTFGKVDQVAVLNTAADEVVVVSYPISLCRARVVFMIAFFYDCVAIEKVRSGIGYGNIS